MKFYPLGKPKQVFDQPSQEQLSSWLFARTAMVEGMKKELMKVLMYPRAKRIAWVTENHDFLSQTLSTLRSQSEQMLQDSPIDHQATRQINEFMINIQQFLSVLEKVVEEEELTQS